MKLLEPNTRHRNALPAPTRSSFASKNSNHSGGIQVDRLRFIVVLNLLLLIIFVADSSSAIATTTTADATKAETNPKSLQQHSSQIKPRSPSLGGPHELSTHERYQHSDDDEQDLDSNVGAQEQLYKISSTAPLTSSLPPPPPHDVELDQQQHSPSDHNDPTAADQLEPNQNDPLNQESVGPSAVSEKDSVWNTDNLDEQQLQQQSPDVAAENGGGPADSSTERILISVELVREVCRLNRGTQRSEPLKSIYLNYCSRYKLENLLSSEILESIMHKDSQVCEQVLNEFIKLDELINQFDGMFKNLLTRYNCHNGYSVKWNCEDCKKAYKDWLCATNLPFYMTYERIKPCISFCERVEQRCPYLHPITKEQYGGQPVFICRDPNIPFIPEITPDIPFSDPKKCYELCHLRNNRTELVNDSLSKYDHNKCPNETSIAEEVKSDPYLGNQDGLGDNRQSIDDAKNHLGADDQGVDLTDLQLNGDGGGVVLTTNKSSHGQVSSNQRKLHAHLKRLDELREVLAVYKNQPKSHKFGHHVDHSSLSPSTIDSRHHHSLLRKSLDYI